MIGLTIEAEHVIRSLEVQKWCNWLWGKRMETVCEIWGKPFYRYAYGVIS